MISLSRITVIDVHHRMKSPTPQEGYVYNPDYGYYQESDETFKDRIKEILKTKEQPKQ